MRLLFFGDVVGDAAQAAVIAALPALRAQYQPDYWIANVENASAGAGLSHQDASALFAAGFAALTGGNHSLDRPDAPEVFSAYPHLLRPANLPEPAPGRGLTIVRAPGAPPLGIANVMGQAFMPPVTDPWASLEEALGILEAATKFILIDIHAETTSEKALLAYAADGRASAVVGTHTHIQTNDARLLPQGTALITEAGASMVRESLIGNDLALATRKYRGERDLSHRVAKGPLIVQGVCITLAGSGRATGIEPFQHFPEEPRSRP